MIEAPRLEAIDLWFGYAPERPALRGADLVAEPGEFLALVGQNGSGKSTLAKHLNGLLRPARGRVRLDGEDISGLSIGRLARQVGYVFQNPDHQLFSPSVEQELGLGPRYLGLTPAEVEDHVQRGLQSFGLQSIAQRGPGTLSFGLRRVVSIAAVATLRPPVFILDEPTTGLDWGNAAQLMDHFTELNMQGHSVILITHDMRLVVRYASRVAVMSEGRMVGSGTPAEIFRQPELLESTRLEPPPIVELVHRLASSGVEIEGLTAALACRSFLARHRVKLG
jgi:energy-coupling factor transport system ATP-binding protein